MIKGLKMKNYIPCIVCGEKADWSYMPGGEDYCEKHVPRGCTCNLEEDGSEELDDNGRRFPCCEYMGISPELHNDEEIVQTGWDKYYEEHPEVKEIFYEEKEQMNPIEKMNHSGKDKLWGRGAKSKPKGFKHNRRKLNKRR